MLLGTCGHHACDTIWFALNSCEASMLAWMEFIYVYRITKYLHIIFKSNLPLQMSL